MEAWERGLVMENKGGKGDSAPKREATEVAAPGSGPTPKLKVGIADMDKEPRSEKKQ